LKKKLLATAVLVAVAASMAACSAVSFTHANGAKGQSITNAEVQPDNTVVLAYPNGSACIDTIPAKASPAKETDMRTLTLCLALSCLLTGCVSQRYVGVQITTTEPIALTRISVNGENIRICSTDEKNTRHCGG